MSLPIVRGSGTPEGAIDAPPGTIYERKDGGNGTSAYVKQTASGTLTGWQALAVGATNQVFSTDDGQAGMYALPMGALAGMSSVTPTANRAYVQRFVPTRSMTITKISFGVITAATADDACDVGIFSGDWTALLGSAGATTGKLNSGGGKTVPLTTPVVLTANTVYYAAMSVGSIGGTGCNLAMTNWQANAVALFGQSAGLQAQSFQAAAHPLAAPFVSAGLISTAPILAVREG